MTQQTDNKQHAENKANDADVKRRRLLKGLAAGVPVIATVHHNNAAALSNTICVTKNQTLAGSLDQIPVGTPPPYDNNDLVPCLIPGQAEPTPFNWHRENDGTPNEQCLVYYDSSGNPVAMAPDDPMGGTPLTESCLTSFITDIV